jgi:hypothetical protein
MSIRIFDVLGRIVMSVDMERGIREETFTIDCSALASGAYLCVVDAGTPSSLTFLVSR